MMLALAGVCFFCAMIPAVMFAVNLGFYVEPPENSREPISAVSVLIPARNEAGSISAAVHAALASRGVDVEVVVMDDGSSDGTDAVVLALTAADSRVRLERAPALPAGWNGKQHACWALAQVARSPVLCFVDADVRLKPECVARMAAFLEGKSLVSGFPRQVTGTFLEWMLLPLIHFVLLGFLPVARMRRSTDPAFAAGCGQFMMARAKDYFACGGHSGIKLTMHDGLRLPKLFRASGFKTDLADLTELACCRMYTSAAQVWSGLAKNAVEGLADPKRIVPVSLLLVLGQVLPFITFLGLIAQAIFFMPKLYHHMFVFGVSLIGYVWLGALACAWLPRLLGVIRFRQSLLGAVLHPFGIVLLLAIQWGALFRKLRGGAVGWRDRVYVADEN